MKKRAIPSIPIGQQPREKFDTALKEDLEIIMGQRGARVGALPATATLAEVIAKVNEILTRLQ